MTTSMNGWPASQDPDAIDCDWYTVPGTNVRLRLSSHAAPLLVCAARAWHRKVEPLKEGWCWSYAYRNISGTSTLSNHSSGTAIDLNAPWHPMGVPASKTLTFRQRVRARRIAKRFGLTWGGTWTTRPDAMHYEVRLTPAQAKAKIRKMGISC